MVEVSGRDYAFIREEKSIITYVLCGFIKSFVITHKIGIINYMLPCWVYRVKFKISTLFDTQHTKYVLAALKELKEY